MIFIAPVESVEKRKDIVEHEDKQAEKKLKIDEVKTKNISTLEKKQDHMNREMIHLHNKIKENDEKIKNMKQELRKSRIENHLKSIALTKARKNFLKVEKAREILQNRIKRKRITKMKKIAPRKEAQLISDEELLIAYEVCKDQLEQISSLENIIRKNKLALLKLKLKLKRAKSRESYYKEKSMVLSRKHYSKIIENLRKDITAKKDEIKSLNEKFVMGEENKVSLMSEGKYNDKLRIVVMALHNIGLSTANISKAINIVVKDLLKLKIDNLPSTSTCNNIIVEGRHASQYQVVDKILSDCDKDLVLHTDGTKKFSKHYGATQIASSQGQFSVGMHSMESETAQNVFNCNKSVLEELAKTYANIKKVDEKEILEELLLNCKNIMTDQGAVNKPFSELYEKWRESILSKSEKFDTLSSEEVQQLRKVNSFHCWLHFVINLARCANKSLKGYEHLADLQLKPFKSGDSIAFQAISQAAKLFTGRGSDKYGLYNEFTAVLENDKNLFHRQTGNREYVFFDNAISLLYHHKKGHISLLLSRLKYISPILSELDESLKSPTVISGIKALCIAKYSIIDPIWKQMGKINSILEINELSNELQEKMKSWKDNATTLRSGEETISSPEEKTTDAVQTLVFMEDSEDIECATLQALEYLCFHWLIFIERYNKEQLPGGKYWNPSQILKDESKNVSVHNMLSERDFSWLDRLIRIKPSASTLHLEAVIMTSLNKTPEYLLKLPENERENIMKEARRNTNEARQLARLRAEEISRKRKEIMIEREKENERKEIENKLYIDNITNKIANDGGVWKHFEIEKRLLAIEKKAKTTNSRELHNIIKEALKTQLQYHKSVRNTKVQDKTLFQMQKTIQGKVVINSIHQLKENLKTITKDIQDNKIQEPGPAKPSFVLAEKFQEAKHTLNSQLLKQRQKLFPEQYSTNRVIPLNKIKKYKKNKIRNLDIEPEYLIGKEVDHIFEEFDANGKLLPISQRTYEGKVVRIVKKTEDPLDCIFEI